VAVRCSTECRICGRIKNVRTFVDGYKNVRTEYQECAKEPYGYCSTVQSLLEWFEVDLRDHRESSVNPRKKLVEQFLIGSKKLVEP